MCPAAMRLKQDSSGEVAHGQLHDESIGPEGARILVGRKYSGGK